jgi:hypothetical protein
MIVYGDPSSEARLPVLVARLRERIDPAAAAGDPARSGCDALDMLRALLIAAGQVEQAAEDGAADERTRGLLRAITDVAAAAFVGTMHQTDRAAAIPRRRGDQRCVGRRATAARPARRCA